MACESAGPRGGGTCATRRNRRPVILKIQDRGRSPTACRHQHGFGYFEPDAKRPDVRVGTFLDFSEIEGAHMQARVLEL